MKTLAFIIIFFGFLITSACQKSSDVVVLQSISFNPETLTVTLATNGKQLTPVFTPAVFSSIAVDWSTTDNAVLAVSSSGVLIPVQKGEAWVKIKDKNSATMGKCLIIVQ